MPNPSVNKKKLMFVKGEDYYFISYNILLLLHALDANSKETGFKDYKKISFLIDFIADNKLAAIIDSYTDSTSNINPIDKDILSRAYTDGLVRINQVLKLVLYLYKKNLISIEKNKSADSLNIWLNSSSIHKDFLDSDLFINEYNNINALTKKIKKIKLIKRSTMIDDLFMDFNITKWQI